MAREDTIIRFGAVDQLSPVLKKLDLGFGALQGGIGKFIASTATIGTAALAIGRTINAFDQLGESARKLNVSTEALSRFNFAAKLSGSSAETFSAGLQKLNVQLGQALSGNDRAAGMFEALGVSIRDAAGNSRDAESVLLDVADAFANMRDGAEETAIAAALFGKSAGPELVQFLNQGSAGIIALGDEAQRLGVVLSEDAAAAAGEFNDTLDRLVASGQGVLNSFTAAVLPALNEFSGAAAKAASDGGLLSEAGRLIGEQFNLFGADLITAQSEIQQLGAEIANAVQFLTDWAENLGVVGNIAIVAFESIEAAAGGNFEAAERGLNAITVAVDALGRKAAADAAKRMEDLAGAIGDIKADAAARIDRIKGGVEGLGKAAKPAADGVAKIKPPMDAFGDSAARADAKLEGIKDKLQGDLKFALEGYFRDGLKPATEKMQEFDAVTGQVTRSLVEDVPQALTRASDEFEGFGGILTVEAEAMQDNWLGATEAVNDAFADFVAGNIRSFEDFGDALEGIARQFLANLVRQFLSTNLQLPVPSFGGGGLGGSGGLGSLGGSALNFLNAGGPLLSTLGPAALLLAGASTGNRGTGAGAGALAGGLFASTGFGAGLIGSGLAGLAGTSGTILGAQLGSVVPIVGTIIGAVLGTLASSLFAAKPPSINVIGDEVVGTPGFRNFAPGSTFESQLGGFTFASIDSVDRQTRDQIGQAVVDFDNAIADLPGITEDQLGRITDALAGFNLRLQEGAISADNILGARFEAILSTFDEDTQAFVRNAGDLQAQVQALAEVLERPARLSALLDSLEEADRLAGISPFEQALERIDEQFDAAAEAAEELGATQAQLARIEELRGNAIERLEQAQRTSLDSLLRDLRLDELPGAERAIVEINDRFDALREQAIALGASQEDLELIERRRTAALREQADATRDSTDAIQEFSDAAQQSFQLYLDYQADWLEGLGNALQPVRDFLNGGASVSSLNPLQRLQQSQGQFQEIVRQISIGNVDAIRGFSGGANAFLQQAAAFYGVGSAEFQGIEAAVLSTARGITGTNTGGSMAEALASLRPLFQRMIDLLANNGALTAQQTQQVTQALLRLGGTPARAV